MMRWSRVPGERVPEKKASEDVAWISNYVGIIPGLPPQLQSLSVSNLIERRCCAVTPDKMPSAHRLVTTFACCGCFTVPQLATSFSPSASFCARGLTTIPSSTQLHTSNMGGSRRGSARGESMVAKEQEKRKIESVSGAACRSEDSMHYGQHKPLILA